MKKFLGNILGNTLSALGIVLTDAQLEQAEHITAIVCMAVGLAITVISSVIIPLVKWWKDAKKDGKIDEEEIKEGKNIFMRLIDIIKNFFNKNKKGR